MLTKRQHQVVSYLMQQSQPISVNDIARFCNVSNKTIRNELNMIDKIAASYQLSILRKPSVGVTLLKKDDQGWKRLMESVIYTDKIHRQQMLLFCLLTQKKCNNIRLADQLQVSRQTITRDLDQLPKTFDIQSKHLIRTTHGSFLAMDELSLRIKIKNQWLPSKITEGFDGYLVDHFKNEHEQVRVWLSLLEKQLDTEFEIHSLEHLQKLATILLIRSRLVPTEQPDLSSSVIDLFDFSTLPFDKLSLRLLFESILGSRLSKGSLSFSHTDDDLAIELLEKLFEVLQLKPDMKEAQVIGLHKHLRATITRIKTGKMLENPLMEDVRVSLGLLYEVVQSVMADFEKDHHLSFSEHEITYIVMHLGVLMQSKVFVDAPIKIAVVCQHGAATSMLLFSRIQAMLPSHQIMGPYSVKEFEVMAKMDVFDTVITTIPLGLSNQLIVSPLLTIKDTMTIEKTIWSCTYRKQCDLLLNSYRVTKQEQVIMAQMIKPHHIQFSDEPLSWQQAITLAADPLLQEAVIEKTYIDKMIWAVETLGPYMVILPKVAFVHAAYDDGVNRNGISCLWMQQAIDFGKQRTVEVKVIFVIASKAKEDTGLLKLVRILESDDNLELLLKSHDKRQILAMKG